MNASLNSWARCADAPYLTGLGHSAVAAPEPPASLSADLFGRATAIPWPYHTLSSCCQRAYRLTNLNLSGLVVMLVQTRTP